MAQILRNDRFSIMTNITSFAIGCIIDSQVREELCLRLSVPQMLYDLNLIASNNKDLATYIEGDTLLVNPWRKSFLIGLDSTVYTVARMTLPEGLRNSDIFRTGITLNTIAETKDEVADDLNLFEGAI